MASHQGQLSFECRQKVSENDIETSCELEDLTQAKAKLVELVSQKRDAGYTGCHGKVLPMQHPPEPRDHDCPVARYRDTKTAQ